MYKVKKHESPLRGKGAFRSGRSGSAWAGGSRSQPADLRNGNPTRASAPQGRMWRVSEQIQQAAWTCNERLQTGACFTKTPLAAARRADSEGVEASGRPGGGSHSHPGEAGR